MTLTDKITTRDQLHSALYDAAELEHTVCCQYLFAAFSLKCHPDEGLDALELDLVRDWKSQLLLLARQEMVHLGVVCNLLTVVGGAPHLERADFPMRAVNYPGDLKFELLPFSLETLDRFIQFEQPQAAQAAPPPEALTSKAPKARLPVKIRGESQTGAVRVCGVEAGACFDGEALQPGDEVSHIWNQEPRSGQLRQQIEQAEPGTPVPIGVQKAGQLRTVVARLAPSEGPSDSMIGYESVSELYAKIEDGLESLKSKTKPPLLVNLGDGQLSNENLGWPEKEVVHDMSFPRIKDLETAKEAVRIIQRQGEGTLSEEGHYGMLLKMRSELEERLKQSGGRFMPARPVLPNPCTRDDAGGSLGRKLEGSALDVAYLLNYANETMLMMLFRLYADAGLKESRFEMLRETALRSIMTMVIRPVGEMLTEMPAQGDNGRRAGATFEVGRRIPLIHNRSAAWSMFHERLLRLVDRSAELMTRPGVPDRMKYVHQNLKYLADDLGKQLKSE